MSFMMNDMHVMHDMHVMNEYYWLYHIVDFVHIMKRLVTMVNKEKKQGLLDHKWQVRQYLAKQKKNVRQSLNDWASTQGSEPGVVTLLQAALSPFHYLERHH